MKRILITGATSGIGLALTQLAHEQGFMPIACGRDQAKLESHFSKSAVETLCFDVTDKQATAQAFEHAQADIYVFNAGTCEYFDNGVIDTELCNRVFATNFFGIIHCLEAIQDKLSAGNQVVLIESLARLMPFARAEAYGASKAALHYFAKSLAVDWQDREVLVQTAAPGFVETPLTDKNDFAMPMQISAQQAAQYLLSGIQKKHKHIYFPKRFATLLRLLALLPENLKERICTKLQQNQGAHS